MLETDYVKLNKIITRDIHAIFKFYYRNMWKHVEASAVTLALILGYSESMGDIPYGI